MTRVVDTHTHLVSSDPQAYPLQPADLPGAWYREAPVSAEDFLPLLDEAGVERAIAVQPLGAYSYDNRYAADCAERFPQRLDAVCSIDPTAGDAVHTLDHWVRERGMRGVRMFALAREGPSWLPDPRTFAVWERAAELGVPAVVTVLWHQLAELRTLLGRFSEIPILLDHCGFPEVTAPPWKEARELFELAEFPNLHLKVSTHVLDAAARSGEPGGFVVEIARHFGGARLMWGSDFPQTHDRSYVQLVELGREAFSVLSPAARDQALGGTALRFWPGPS